MPITELAFALVRARPLLHLVDAVGAPSRYYEGRPTSLRVAPGRDVSGTAVQSGPITRVLEAEAAMLNQAVSGTRKGILGNDDNNSA